MRRLLAVVLLVVALVLGGGVALASGTPEVRAVGPTSVSGTDATSVFRIADRTIRQVRYVDRGTLRYTFSLRNDSRWPVTVSAADEQEAARLFAFSGLADEGGDRSVEVPAGAEVPVTITLDMSGCESLASRSGSFYDQVSVVVERGPFGDEIDLALPEELHTGSPREAACPESTATSRPQG